MSDTIPPSMAAAASGAARQIDRLSAVIERYDGVILDLWGVIHDGERPFPGVIECLAALKAAGKVTCLLSNAPRRIGGMVDKLTGMGIGRDAYDHVMTSGEATHEVLREERLGQRLFHIGPPRDNDVYDDLAITVADRPEDADFVLNTGIDDFDETMDDYRPRLDACAAARLPMICANPDLVVMVGPKRVICAGALAQYYEGLGGSVAWHGKPFASVYARCLSLMGRSLAGVVEPRRIVAIGDSLRTDVAGANAAGIDSILITGGIHQEELGTAWGAQPERARLEAMIAGAEGPRPDWVMPALIW